MPKNDQNIPARLLIGPVGFLRFLLTFACLGIPLSWLETTYRNPIEVLISHLGYGILYFVWLFKVLGRFVDSGRSSNWYWASFCLTVTAASALLLWFGFLNPYEALAFFLLTQVPLFLLPSKVKPGRPVMTQDRTRKNRRRTTWQGSDVQPLVVRPISFLWRLMVIACIWAPLIYFENASAAKFNFWIAHFGYFILGVAWMVLTTARFTDAGLAVGWYISQYCLVVSFASLMPLAVHWFNGFETLAIFVLIQIPTVFLPSKPAPEEPLPDGPPLNESGDGVPNL